MPVEKPNDVTAGPQTKQNPNGGDPTLNVQALSEASNKRQDDLRNAQATLLHAEITHIKEMASLRADYSLRLSEAEAKRIDAIRAVDVNAVAVASERQAAAATVLANQVAQSADALRTLVATTAAATADGLRQSLTQITDRLTVVERSQYEGRGRQVVEDPKMIELFAEIKAMRELTNRGAGGAANSAASRALLFQVITAAVAVGSLAALLLSKG